MEKKRSLKYLLVAACLALLIASLGGIVAGAAGDVETSADHTILGVNLDLNDKISLVYAVEATVAGYDAETGTVQNYVYLYDINPEGTAIEGTKVEDYIVKNLNGKDFVLFITDGFAADEYGETKYARVANYETGIYGGVRKGGVMELVNLMKNNISDSDAKKELKTNLYNTILAYGEQAYKVVHGVDYPYRSITVEDGYIVDNAGAKWTSGIFRVGDTLTLTDGNSLNLTSVGAKLAGWMADGKLLESSTVTVEDNAVYSPAYIRYSSIDANPYMNTGSGSNTNINANLGFYWGDLRYATLAEGLTATEDGYPSTWYDTKTLNFLFNKNNAIQDKIFSVDASGNMSYKIALDKSSKYLSLQQTYDTNFYFDNTSVLGTNPSFKFTMNIPDIDKNGNGIYNEYTSQVVSEGYEDENGDWVEGTATAVMGDTHTNTGFANLFRLYFLFTDRDASTTNEYVTNLAAATYSLIHDNAIAADSPFTMDTVPVIENGFVTGYTLTTFAGADSDNNGTALSTVFELGRDYDFEIKFITDANGMVTSAEIYADGILVGTRTDVCTADSKNKTIYAAGDGARAKFGFAQIDMGRSNMDVIFSNLEFCANDYLTAAEVVALDGYGTYESNVYMANYVPSTTGTTGRNVYNVKWDQLASLSGVDTFGNYYSENLANNHLANKNASWLYDATTNSIIYKKIGTAAPGRISIYADNPLKDTEYVAGKAIVFEFEVGMLLNDKDGDRVWNERNADDARDSAILGTFIFGTHTNEYFENPNSKLAGVQFRRGNGTQWLRLGSNISYDSNYKDSAVYSAGNVMPVKIVYVPAENGTTAQVDLYVGGALLKSMTNVADAATGFTFNQSENASLNSLFATHFVGFNFTAQSNILLSTVFRNVKCYTVDGYTN